MTTVFWESDCVIYHHNSGNTHLLSDVPKDLLQQCLTDTPYEQADLLKALQQYAEFTVQDWSEYINQLLAILLKKELIEQLN